MTHLNNNNSEIREEVFEDVVFDDFVINPKEGAAVSLVDAAFVRCSVPLGSCAISKRVTLRNVLFEDFDCGDRMRVSAEADLQGVVIRGEYPKMIWIRPENGGDHRDVAVSKLAFAVDIKNYSGEVSITGVPIDRVVFNPVDHVAVKADWLQSIDWKEMAVSGLSYWRILAKKVVADGAREGVFSMPPRSGRRFERSMQELEVLRKNGFFNA